MDKSPLSVQKTSSEVTSTDSNGQTALQEHLKDIFSREKEHEKEKEKPEGGTRPTYLPESSGRTPSCSNNKEVFRCFTCTACPPTHSRPLSVCVLSAATPQQCLAALLPHRGSRILRIMWRLTHFVNVSACVWAAACVYVGYLVESSLSMWSVRLFWVTNLDHTM